MATIYGALVENGTGIVQQMVQGIDSAGATPGIPDPGFTAHPVSEADYLEWKAWVMGEPEDADYIRNADGSFSVVGWPDLPAVINKTTIAADGIDAARITGLPDPTTITIQGAGKYLVEDGEFEISYDTPGVIQLICESPGYKMTYFVIAAV